MIKEFDKEYRWLSNFYPVEIPYTNKLVYPSVEHYYVAMKTTDHNIRKEVATIKTAAQVKRFGRNLVLRDDWDDVKLDVMKYALMIKFTQKPFKQQLLDTNMQHLQEGNTWGDRYWGVDLETGEGENHLGILLMEIRASLKKNRIFKTRPFGMLVDLDDPKTYNHLPEDIKELEDRMFREIGYALAYMDYMRPEFFKGSDCPQRSRVNELVKNFSEQKFENNNFNNIQWFKEQVFMFEDEIENMC